MGEGEVGLLAGEGEEKDAHLRGVPLGKRRLAVEGCDTVLPLVAVPLFRVEKVLRVLLRIVSATRQRLRLVEAKAARPTLVRSVSRPTRLGAITCGSPPALSESFSFHLS